MNKAEIEWQNKEVRLFPSVSIRNEREAELRATASVLTVIRAVSEFGRRIVRLAGGPGLGNLSCYTEVPFMTQEQKELRPDGILRRERGDKQWTAFVEVKIGDTDLDQGQIDSYYQLARDHDIQTLITISNQSARSDGTPPLDIAKHRGRKVDVVHFSWERLLSEAQILIGKEGVSDTDHIWILEEWIRYLEDPGSRIIAPPDFGDSWSQVIKLAKTNNLSEDADMLDVTTHWVGYLRKLAFRLQAKLCTDVQVCMTRKERNDPEEHRKNSHDITEGSLNGKIRILDSAGDIAIKILLPSKTAQYSIEVNPPTKGLQATRVKWISRYLKSVPTGNIEVSADWLEPGKRKGFSTSCSMQEYMEDAGRLLHDRDGYPIPKKAEPRLLRIEATRGLRPMRGKSSVPVLQDISQGLEDFYHIIVQDLRPYVPPAPKMKEEPEEGSKPDPRSIDESQDAEEEQPG